MHEFCYFSTIKLQNFVTV